MPSLPFSTDPPPPVGGVPVGAIVAYIGTIDGIPKDHWQLCDGQTILKGTLVGRPTPQLTDNRFLQGVRYDEDVNVPGGSNDVVPGGKHNHGNTATAHDS